MGNTVRMGYQFFGRVQGVGFRYRLSHLAQHCMVTGWVRNEYDGSVSAQLQGREEQLDRVLQLLHQDAYIQIRDTRKEKLPLEEGESGFHIRY